MFRKLSVLLSLVLCCCVLCSCSGNSYMDVLIFEEYFNDLSLNEQMDISLAAVTSKQSGEKEYSVFLSDGSDACALLTLYAKKDGTVFRCDITVSKDGGKLKKSAYAAFKRVSATAVAALTRGTVQRAQDVLEEIGAADEESAAGFASEYLETHFFEYSFTADETGVCFTVENTTLRTDYSEPVSLRR